MTVLLFDPGKQVLADRTGIDPKSLRLLKDNSHLVWFHVKQLGQGQISVLPCSEKLDKVAVAPSPLLNYHGPPYESDKPALSFLFTAENPRLANGGDYYGDLLRAWNQASEYCDRAMPARSNSVSRETCV